MIIQLAILGASGRMGQAIAQLATAQPDFAIAHAFNSDSDMTTALHNWQSDQAAIIDFSNDAGTHQLAKACLGRSVPILVGTTKLSDTTQALLTQCASTAPVMIAPNTSIGALVLSQLACQAAQMLGPDFDIDIIDTHHRHKKDAPSGTAIALQQALNGAAGATPLVHSIRAGDAIAAHTITFHGTQESFEITHTATSRDVFAKGALMLIKWLSQQKPGLYSAANALMKN
jgi:4-hydroxy-tetrahydrodipicolinate reductase